MKVSTKISINDWSLFIKDHPNGTVFQSPEMFDLFQNTRKFDPLVLSAFNDENEICGVLLGVFIHEKWGPGKLLSSRFVIYGGPLLAGSEDQKGECLELLLKELVKQTKRKALFIQFRNYFSWERYLPVFEKHGFTYLERLNYIIRVRGAGFGGRVKVEGRRTKNEERTTKIQQPTISGSQDPAPILKNMSESRRRQIRKGLASGAEIIEPENVEQVRAFYDILFKLYRFKVRKPLADWSFFESFYKQSQSLVPRTQNPIGIIRLVRYEGQIIGGILAPVFENKCIYEWYVCGLDKEYREQHPSVLATWAAIEYAISNKIESFDFMGVGKPDTPYGVRDFKARFGGELVNYGRLTRINNHFLYNIAELGYNILALLKKI